MIKGFKNFLMRDDVITVAIGLVVALAFSKLVESFTDSVINPLVAAAQPDSAFGLGVQLGEEGNEATFMDFGALISGIVYFIVFMIVVYFAIVVPYRAVQARRGITVFGEDEPEPPTKACPECLSDDLPELARKCKHCGSLQTTV
ncbi:mechanosensitive ion channel protein MscL [Mycolicibacillus koreensis]|nr:mechanosensitive ion channel protein MscL [Mycolicibacillus koreensis]